MKRSMRAGAVGLALLIAPPPALAQLPISRGWSITYADGRNTTRPLRHKGSMWTPAFPRVPGLDLPHNGRPLHVLDVGYVADGDDVVATITLVYGRFEDRVKVAEVRVTSAHPVLVVTSVMWDDGSVDGDRTKAVQERTFAMNRRQQLEALLKALGDDAAASRIQELRSAFQALDQRDVELEHVRRAAITKLEQLDREADVSASASGSHHSGRRCPRGSHASSTRCSDHAPSRVAVGFRPAYSLRVI